MYKCIECGRKFKTAKAAQRAANKGCPGCGGVDIDLDTDKPLPPTHKTVIGGLTLDYDDPPLRRRMLG
jgi:hypothetical protein